MTTPASAQLTLIVDGRGKARSHWQAGMEDWSRLTREGDRRIAVVSASEEALEFPSDVLRLESDPTLGPRLWAAVTTPWVAYWPLGTPPGPRPSLNATGPSLMPWPPALALPADTAWESPHPATAWIASTALLQSIQVPLPAAHPLTLLALATALEGAGIEFAWGTASAIAPHSLSPRPLRFPGASPQPVLAIIPHYQCEPWLPRCLRSLLQQTRPLDGIVVVDDGSAHPPVDLVQHFPGVTLLTAAERVGPYRLIQQVMAETHYWAYLFQDADDWASGDRLQRLLTTMAATGADLVGTQELRVVDDTAQITPVNYPLDVNLALSQKPGHGLLHPTSLVTRRLVMQLGGFATGMRFGGDTEFLLRAVWAARVVNIPDYGYFRRKRPGSLTTAPETGLQSPVRQRIIQQCKERAIANRAAVQAGNAPCLTPLAVAAPIALRHLAGPVL